jgi:3-ketosteroid 9alpha-monooxygenase subunit A
MPDHADSDFHPRPQAREITHLPIRNRSSLPTYPNGWFRVASSEEVTADALLPLTYFGAHYVAFRAPDGTARVADAYCPHLGAHLASHTGGKIENGTITCPFHRWQFATDGGQCTRINYSKIVPPKARLTLHPVREMHGMVVMWHHTESLPPDYEPYVETRIDTETGWMKLDPLRWEMYAQQQEFLENIFDSAHILELHNSETLPRFASIDDTPYGTKIVLDIDVPDPEFPVAKCINDYTGISLAVQNNRARGENLLFTSFTPIDEDRVEMTVNAYIKDSGSSELNSAFGTQFIERFKYEVSQDLAILEHKKHLEKPLLCAGDGDILRWRRYTGRFYSEPLTKSR